MITKEKLKEYALLGAELKSIERRLEEMENEMYSAKRIVYSLGRGKRGQKAVNSDFSELLVKILDMKTLYEHKWDRLIDARREIEMAIEALPPAYRAIIRSKYIDGLTWEEVADEVGYSVRQVHRIMKAAGF